MPYITFHTHRLYRAWKNNLNISVTQRKVSETFDLKIKFLFSQKLMGGLYTITMKSVSNLVSVNPYEHCGYGPP